MPTEPKWLGAKFWDDSFWTFSSVGAMAVAGLLINIVVATEMGPAALGIFNQIYAIYVITAQVAVLGIHDSAQRHIATTVDISLQRSMADGAFVVSGAGGITTALVLVAVGPLIGRALESPDVGTGIELAAPGIFFFACNKTLTGILNGKRMMRAFSLTQIARVAVLSAGCFTIALASMPAHSFGIAFTVTEAALFLPLIAISGVRPWRGSPSAWTNWARRHGLFGIRAFFNGLLAEAFIRVDVVMLGLFVGDRLVGVYSFAAFFLEGLYQLVSMGRVVANPILARLLTTGRRHEIGRFSRRAGLVSFLVAVAVAGFLAVAYPQLEIVMPDSIVEEGYVVLLILMAGLLAYAPFVPAEYILLQAGLPGRQSLLMAANVLTNIILNVCLIPIYGLYGACIATAFSFVFSAIALNAMAWRNLGLRGGVLIAATGQR